MNHLSRKPLQIRCFMPWAIFAFKEVFSFLTIILLKSEHAFKARRNKIGYLLKLKQK